MTLTASDVASLTESLGRWEFTEYVCAGLVTIACGGEYVANFTTWFTGGVKEKKERIEKRSTLLLIIALAFELICLVRTNNLSGLVIVSLSERAEEASKKAKLAIDDSSAAKTIAGQATEAASTAIDRARGALDEADAVNREVVVMNKHLVGSEFRLSQIHEFLTQRSLTPKETKDLTNVLKPIADPNMPLVILQSGMSGLGVQVWQALKDAGFKQATLQTSDNLGYGMRAASPSKYIPAASKIAAELLNLGCGPMIGFLWLTADGTPVQIAIGDIRTAPLPQLPSKPK